MHRDNILQECTYLILHAHPYPNICKVFTTVPLFRQVSLYVGSLV